MISRKAPFVEAVLALTLLLGSGILIARAQDSSADSSSSPSLGDAARKARAQKKDSGKPAKVFTNEDVGGLKGTISVIGNEPAPASSTDKSGEKTDESKKTDDKKAAAADSKDTKKEAAKDEGYWRAKFAAARKTLADDSKELDILQREYNLKLEQYSQDPNWAMHQEYSRDDINKTQSEIESKKQDVEKDKQAISDLQDELRKSGGEPGWANEPAGSGSGSSN
jgi:chromosome segregation ATPase